MIKQQCYSVSAASYCCVHSNCYIPWRNAFKFCTEVSIGIIYTPITLGDAAPSVPFSIRSNVIFLWMVCVSSIGHISQGISFKFWTKVYLGIIYKPIDFGDAAFSVPSFIGSKVLSIIWGVHTCTSIAF